MELIDFTYRASAWSPVHWLMGLIRFIQQLFHFIPKIVEFSSSQPTINSLTFQCFVGLVFGLSSWAEPLAGGPAINPPNQQTQTNQPKSNNPAFISLGLFALVPPSPQQIKSNHLSHSEEKDEIDLCCCWAAACRQHSYSIYHSIQKLKVFSFHEHATAILTSNYCYNIFLFHSILSEIKINQFMN